MSHWFYTPPVPPANKKQLTIRLDDDVVEFFRAGGDRWQTHINNVLRAYMAYNKKEAS